MSQGVGGGSLLSYNFRTRYSIVGLIASNSNSKTRFTLVPCMNTKHKAVRICLDHFLDYELTLPHNSCSDIQSLSAYCDVKTNANLHHLTGSTCDTTTQASNILNYCELSRHTSTITITTRAACRRLLLQGGAEYTGLFNLSTEFTIICIK